MKNKSVCSPTSRNEQCEEKDGEGKKDGNAASADTLSTLERCPICLNILTLEVGFPEECRHAFCIPCILKWSETSTSCPVDRKPFQAIYKTDPLGSWTKITVKERTPREILTCICDQTLTHCTQGKLCFRICVKEEATKIASLHKENKCLDHKEKPESEVVSLSWPSCFTGDNIAVCPFTLSEETACFTNRTEQEENEICLIRRKREALKHLRMPLGAEGIQCNSTLPAETLIHPPSSLEEYVFPLRPISFRRKDFSHRMCAPTGTQDGTEKKQAASGTSTSRGTRKKSVQSSTRRRSTRNSKSGTSNLQSSPKSNSSDNDTPGYDNAATATTNTSSSEHPGKQTSKQRKQAPKKGSQTRKRLRSATRSQEDSKEGKEDSESEQEKKCKMSEDDLSETEQRKMNQSPNHSNEKENSHADMSSPLEHSEEKHLLDSSPANNVQSVDEDSLASPDLHIKNQFDTEHSSPSPSFKNCQTDLEDSQTDLLRSVNEPSYVESAESQLEIKGKLSCESENLNASHGESSFSSPGSAEHIISDHTDLPPLSCNKVEQVNVEESACSPPCTEFKSREHLQDLPSPEEITFNAENHLPTSLKANESHFENESSSTLSTHPLESAKQYDVDNTPTFPDVSKEQSIQKPPNIQQLEPDDSLKTMHKQNEQEKLSEGNLQSTEQEEGIGEQDVKTSVTCEVDDKDKLSKVNLQSTEQEERIGEQDVKTSVTSEVDDKDKLSKVNLQSTEQEERIGEQDVKTSVTSEVDDKDKLSKVNLQATEQEGRIGEQDVKTSVTSEVDDKDKLSKVNLQSTEQEEHIGEQDVKTSVTSEVDDQDTAGCSVNRVELTEQPLTLSKNSPAELSDIGEIQVNSLGNDELKKPVLTDGKIHDTGKKTDLKNDLQKAFCEDNIEPVAMECDSACSELNDSEVEQLVSITEPTKNISDTLVTSKVPQSPPKQSLPPCDTPKKESRARRSRFHSPSTTWSPSKNDVKERPRSRSPSKVRDSPTKRKSRSPSREKDGERGHGSQRKGRSRDRHHRRHSRSRSRHSRSKSRHSRSKSRSRSGSRTRHRNRSVTVDKSEKDCTSPPWKERRSNENWRSPRGSEKYRRNEHDKHENFRNEKYDARDSAEAYPDNRNDYPDWVVEKMKSAESRERGDTWMRGDGRGRGDRGWGDARGRGDRGRGRGDFRGRGEGRGRGDRGRGGNRGRGSHWEDSHYGSGDSWNRNVNMDWNSPRSRGGRGRGGFRGGFNYGDQNENNWSSRQPYSGNSNTSGQESSRFPESKNKPKYEDSFDSPADRSGWSSASSWAVRKTLPADVQNYYSKRGRNSTGTQGGVWPKQEEPQEQDQASKDQASQQNESTPVPVNVVQTQMNIVPQPIAAPPQPMNMFPYPMSVHPPPPPPMVNIQHNPFTLPPPLPIHLHPALPLVQVSAPSSVPQGLPPPPPPPPPSQQISYIAPQQDGKPLQKIQIQERAAHEVKVAIRPYYQNKDITKDEYKEIVKKAVDKVCHSKSGEVDSAKVANLIKAYVDKYKHSRKKGPDDKL
ncbi:protein SCAF11 isoform X2 [Bufo gargarizans]|uniref:protein SCAF11 isoform X2 n=1 Tax=Bufo gargarizans TaxID=30331 RepID=UPI001CF3ADCC|nr:protein SCAF11 isoform X2 [Bufo gargarizans]